jgi:hypothetical protein
MSATAHQLALALADAVREWMEGTRSSTRGWGRASRFDGGEALASAFGLIFAVAVARTRLFEVDRAVRLVRAVAQAGEATAHFTLQDLLRRHRQARIVGDHFGTYSFVFIMRHMTASLVVTALCTRSARAAHSSSLAVLKAFHTRHALTGGPGPRCQRCKARAAPCDRLTHVVPFSLDPRSHSAAGG